MSINSFRYSARCLAGGTLGVAPLHHVHALGCGDPQRPASQEAALRRQTEAVWQVAPALPGQISAESFQVSAPCLAVAAFDIAPLHPIQAQGGGDAAGDAGADATHRLAALPAAKLHPSRSLLQSAVDAIVNCLRRCLWQRATEYEVDDAGHGGGHFDFEGSPLPTNKSGFGP